MMGPTYEQEIREAYECLTQRKLNAYRDWLRSQISAFPASQEAKGSDLMASRALAHLGTVFPETRVA